jgi:hypothetical protein
MTYTDFHEEKKVRIINVPAKYIRRRLHLQNAIGIIKEVTVSAEDGVIVGVFVEGQNNPASSKNLFWFTKNEITIINDEGEDITMTITSYNKKYKFCYTTKPGNNSGALELHAYQGELHDGNYVICNNNYCNGALSVRIVVKSLVPREELETDSIDGEVMGVADIDAYVLRKENEKKAAELRKKMAERAKAYQEEAFWKMMAKEDEQIAALLKEYEEVNG